MSNSVIPWTVTLQASLSMGFFRQESGVGCHSLLQRIFPTQASGRKAQGYKGDLMPTFQSPGKPHLDTGLPSVCLHSLPLPVTPLTVKGQTLQQCSPQAQPCFQPGLLGLRIAQLLFQQMASLILAMWCSPRDQAGLFRFE